MKTIEKIEIEKISSPLKKPYILSFQTLESFDALIVTIILESGESRSGEVVPLLGYSTESAQDIQEYLHSRQLNLIGLDLGEARSRLEQDIKMKPFSTTAILTAIDLFELDYNLDFNPQDFQFVTPSSTEKVDELHQLHREVCLEKGETLKVKLSGKPEVDIAAIQSLKKDLVLGKSKLRLDANQAYSLEGGIEFFKFLSSLEKLSCIQYVEQPFPVKDWEFNEICRENYPEVPIMLDESIVTEEDIDKAYSMKIDFIKLKLYKQGGIKELIGCAAYAMAVDIDVILGNGVAGQLTNAIEIEAFNQNRELFLPVLEANGFLKLA